MTHIKTIIRIDKTIHKVNKKTGEFTQTKTTIIPQEKQTTFYKV
jgi:hypothetical protein